MFFNNNNNCCCQNNNWQQEGSCCEMDRQCGCGCGPIVEQPIERCVERDICHKVEHICPIHTHVVNKHVYNHTYTPRYTCSEENQIINNDCGKCSGFMN